MNFSYTDNFYMQVAINEAKIAFKNGDVPCGAVIVLDNKIIGRGHNKIELLNNPTAHAEMLAITQACQKHGNWRLTNAKMYVTKEPCIMCSGAIILARISSIAWGMSDEKKGGGSSKFNIFDNNQLNHSVKTQSGIMESECTEIFKTFFKKIRSSSSSKKK